MTVLKVNQTVLGFVFKLSNYVVISSNLWCVT